ncbi:VWA domain-containing protein [bacterium]|nr:VWA domain-containing protein [bacterium]
MNRELTDITIVLDRSGSMEPIRDATVEGVNGFLASHRGQPGTRISLIQFDDQYEPLFVALPIADTPAIDLIPRGSTALLDAVGRSIQETGQRLAMMPEEERPGTVMFVIQTDGYENASRLWSLQRVNEAICHQREKYAWQFVFLGANQDAIATAAQMGIPGQSAMTYAANEQSVDAAYRAVSAASHRLVMNRRTLSLDAAFEFKEAERKETLDTDQDTTS